MFWKRFYFVVILLSCNCFLLCSNWFCEFVKKLCCCGQPEQNNHNHVYGKDGNLNNNIYNNSNLVNEKNNHNEENSEENNDYDDILAECKFYRKNVEGDVIDLSGCNISKHKITSGLKCVFLSDTTKVGKTSILNYIVNTNFNENYTETIFYEFSLVKYEDKNNAVQMEINLWDSACCVINAAYIKNFICGAKAIVFVYDITNRESFDSLQDYVSKIKEIAPKDCLFFLLGNKLDLVSEEERKVATEEAQKLAADNGLIFLGECSPKTNTYIPAQDLYCKQKDLLNEKEECTDGIKGMLKDIIYDILLRKKQ